jgi:hypothetical protein
VRHDAASKAEDILRASNILSSFEYTENSET